MRVGESHTWITCDGKVLPEFAQQTEDDGWTVTVSCFIPSEAGKNFQVHCNPDADSRVFLSLDGSPVSNVQRQRGLRSKPFDGLRLSPTERQPFKFAAIQTTDSEDVLLGRHSEELGVIELSVRRARINFHKPYIPAGAHRSRSEWETRKYKDVWTPVGTLHETLKKAGTHQVSLGETRRIKLKPGRRSPGWSAHLINPDEAPIMRFIFRYKPLAVLQADGIAPLPASRTRDEDDCEKRPTKRRRLHEKSTNVAGVIDITNDEVSGCDSKISRGDPNKVKGKVFVQMKKEDQRIRTLNARKDFVDLTTLAK